MNRQIRQLAAGLMVLYVALFATLNYWQVVRQSDLNARFENTRAIRREFDSPRGPILTVDGTVVARSVRAPEGSPYAYQREYPEGSLYAGITGYYTFGFGSTQIERTENDILVGTTGEQQIRGIPEILTGKDTTGSVRLTIRDDLQRLARDQLGDREGAVVVIDTHTGAIRAMWSYPSYDPNLIVNPDGNAAGQVLEMLNAAEGDPLLANAYQQRYMPGSTFKVITTGIGLEDGVLNLQSSFPDASSWVPPQTSNPIRNYNGSVCGGDLAEVFARSCNIPFAETALNLGVDRMSAGVARWGIGERLPIDLPRPAASTFGPTDELGQALPLLAMRGFGQNEVQMVPLHMAMVAATVANGGNMMQPYVVDATLDHAGGVIASTAPQVWKTPLSAQNAATLTQLMIGVATNGTARCCIGLNGGIPVAAKTGTAQLNSDGQPERSHAWIVAFAPADAPRYAVAVVIEGTTADISASTGGQLAGPIAKAMLDQALAGQP